MSEMFKASAPMVDTEIDVKEEAGAMAMVAAVMVVFFFAVWIFG